jgi:hypothetical protein
MYVSLRHDTWLRDSFHVMNDGVEFPSTPWNPEQRALFVMNPDKSLYEYFGKILDSQNPA